MGRHRAFRFGLGLLAATLGVAPGVQAQVLTGVVRDGATGQGVAAAVVTGLGEGPRVERRVLSASSGAFRLPIDGVTHLRVVRIGYRPWEISLARLAGDTVTVELIPVGRLLDAVVVNTSAVCPARRDQREALALWATGQDGLLALVVASASESETGELTQILFDRRLESDGRGIYQQSTRRVRTGNMAPIRAGRDAETLARSGYVERKAASTVYYAPDPTTLLDETFAETHCLSIRTDPRGHPEQTGIAFTPIAGRDTIPDIAGVLWLSRAPVELRSLDFEYVGVDSVVRATRAGGRIDFETLSNGIPIIRSWHVRSPRLVYLPAGTLSRGRMQAGRPIASVSSLHETGALIASGTLPDGTAWSVPLASIAGRVVNARTGDAVAGARVVLDSTDHVTRSDLEGRFTFEGLLPGPYVVRVTDSVAVPGQRPPARSAADPSMADTSAAKTRGTDGSATGSLPFAIPEIVARTRTLHVEARLGDVRQVEVRLPWRDALGACHAPAGPRRRFVLVGTVVTPDGAPLAQAAVRLAWSDSARADSSASRGGPATVIDARTDAEGRFVVCGAPAEEPVGAQVVDIAGTRFEGSVRVPMNAPRDAIGQVYRGPVRFVTLTVARAKRP